MKIDVREPVNKFFYGCRTAAIIGTIGLVIGAGFIIMAIEKIRAKKRERYFKPTMEDNYE